MKEFFNSLDTNDMVKLKHYLTTKDLKPIVYSRDR